MQQHFSAMKADPGGTLVNVGVLRLYSRLGSDNLPSVMISFFRGRPHDADHLVKKSLNNAFRLIGTRFDPRSPN